MKKKKEMQQRNRLGDNQQSKIFGCFAHKYILSKAGKSKKKLFSISSDEFIQGVVKFKMIMPCIEAAGMTVESQPINITETKSKTAKKT